MSPVTVLIVEPKAALRGEWAAALGHKYEILEAADGPAAWEAVLARRPEVVLTELALRGFDGVELVERIKGREDLAATLVGVITEVTAGEELPGAFWMKGLGADGFLQKPVAVEEVRAFVEDLIRKKVNPLPMRWGGYL